MVYLLAFVTDSFITRLILPLFVVYRARTHATTVPVRVQFSCYVGRLHTTFLTHRTRFTTLGCISYTRYRDSCQHTTAPFGFRVRCYVRYRVACHTRFTTTLHTFLPHLPLTPPPHTTCYVVFWFGAVGLTPHPPFVTLPYTPTLHHCVVHFTPHTAVCYARTTGYLYFHHLRLPSSRAHTGLHPAHAPHTGYVSGLICVRTFVWVHTLQVPFTLLRFVTVTSLFTPILLRYALYLVVG